MTEFEKCQAGLMYDTTFPGTKIGSNVVIGAGSVVVHDIPDNCVAFGDPGKPYRAIIQEDLEKIR